MSPRSTLRILLVIWLFAAGGCSWLPSRGQRDATQTYPDPQPLNLSAGNRPQAQPGPATSMQNTVSQAQGAMAASPMLGGAAQTLPNLSDANSAAMMAPVAEVSQFIRELENASHIDPATRSQILATALQAPPEQQSQLIRQYRALLALGQTAATQAAPAPTTSQPAPSTVPATVPPPAEPAVAEKVETVVPASHNEPIEPERASDVERQLEALLKAMKGGKEGAPLPDAEVGPSEKRSTPFPEATEAVSSRMTWQELVDSAIEKLEARKERKLDSELGEQDEARLRMLYLIAGRRDDAVRAISKLEPEMQEYWSKQFYALATLLNSEAIADRSNRLVESKRNLDEAIRRLGESSPLFVRNLAFITKVDSYGAYEPFDDYEFQPGQLVILYAEVENYRCKETARGYHTALRSSYEIFDSSRRKVADHEFSSIEEYCKNARRDFYNSYEFFLPKNLSSGKYVLRLTVHDLNGDKAGESSITFHIRDE